MVSFTAPQDTYLKRESERLGISISDVVRRVVDAHRTRTEPPTMNTATTRVRRERDARKGG